MTCSGETAEGKAPAAKTASADRRTLDGKEISTEVGVLAAYQVGDFYYQYLKDDGTRGRVRSCLSISNRNHVVGQVRIGRKVIIQHIPRQP